LGRCPLAAGLVTRRIAHRENQIFQSHNDEKEASKSEGQLLRHVRQVLSTEARRLNAAGFTCLSDLS
jgi:hypothetical protein